MLPLKVLSLIRLTFKLMPLIIQAVVFVEKLYPGGGNGGLKKSLIRDTLEDLYELDVDKDGLPDLEQIWNMIDRRVDRIVDRFNKDGWPNLDEIDV